MSIHPSLRAADKNKKQKSVLKRIERLKMMAEKEEWKEGDSVFGLPKIKTVRIKIKKEKAEKATETATGAAPAAEGAAKAPAAKGTPAKTPEKK
ncbi:MAG: small basic protein [Candidatus Omnitrophica bacterium]|nr:small basic protein [Candidatus Omnitrophota bacterium]